MKIAAVGDVHSPRYLGEFGRALNDCSPPDLFLLAGDIVDQGVPEEFAAVVSMIRDRLGTAFPIVGCYGNQEYTELRKAIASRVRDHVVMLDERDLILTIRGIRIGIVGTQGSLTEPTSWQRRNIPRVRTEFERRARRAESLLQRIRPSVDRVILLMHYSPCLATCRGEPERVVPWTWSRRFEELIRRESPDLVIHGHAHNSVVHEAWIDGTLVRNVSLPATGRITQLELWTDD